MTYEGKTPISDKFLSTEEGCFFDFISKVEARLREGKREYGDSSFKGKLKLEEIQQELLDVAGWASIEWFKLERLKQHMSRSTEEVYNVWDDGDLTSF
jgi:hypothetical protein